MKELHELNTDLEGRLTFDGKEVWKAVMIGTPTVVSIKDISCEKYAREIAKFAPRTANAYLKGLIVSHYIPVQYYKLHRAPNGPGFD